ncbi:MAG TPA: YceI family protein [bacterium]|nr:YceI family protein [bacterium]
MKFSRLAVFSAATLALWFAPQTGRAEIQSFNIDPYYSQAIILVPHYEVCRTGGMFGGLTGTIEFDTTTMTDWAMDVTIPVATFISTHGPRTDAVKGPQLLDAPTYPEIHFSCKSVEKKGEEYVAKGTITICNTPKEVTFPMTFKGPKIDPFGNSRIGLDGSFQVNRQDFGLPFDRKLPGGGAAVGDMVDIQFQVEGIRGTKGAKAPDMAAEKAEAKSAPPETKTGGK